VIGLLFLAAVATMAQEPSSPTFRGGVQLIQLTVVAQDKQGKPVMDLRREDFQVLDNGSPRDISLFVAEKPASSQPESKAPGVFTNQIASSAGSRAAYSVILIDNLFTDFLTTGRGGSEEGGGFGVQKALRALRSIPRNEKIAIYAMNSRKIDVLCEFTSDRDLLERQLRKWKASTDTPELSAEILTNDGGGPYASANAAATEHAVGDAYRHPAIRRAAASDDEISALADHLGGIPGHKRLIWLSNRFVISPSALRELSDAGFAIYPVDVDGVCVCPGASTCNTCPQRPVALMEGIAAQTGGVAFHGRNDLDVAIREAIEDGRTGYTLGFYRSDDDRSSQVHRIAVHVIRTDLTLRYGASYEVEPARTPAAATKPDLARALNAAADATAVSIRASATRAQDRLDIHVVVDAAGLKLALNRNQWIGRIEMGARFMAADGKPVGEAVSQRLNLNLRQATYDSVVQQGIAYHNVLKIPPAAVELRLLFANPASGKIGTFTLPLSEVPITGAVQ
jgi:VWFA-related protein